MVAGMLPIASAKGRARMEKHTGTGLGGWFDQLHVADPGGDPRCVRHR
nr:hypothetical protein [Haliscomenobacter sp.]